MPRPKIDYTAAKRLVLAMLYDAYLNDEPMAFSVARIQKRLPIQKNIITVTLGDLEEESLIEQTQRQVQRTTGVLRDQFATHWVDTGEYILTSSGRAAVERLTDDQYDLAHAILNDDPAGRVVREPDGTDVGLPPDRWEPLPIEPGDPDLAKVRTSLSELVDTVAKDNGYRSSEPDERAGVLAALRAADTILSDASCFTYSHLVAYVFTPLEKLSKRFSAETVIGVGVKVLWEAVKDWAKKKVGLGLDDIFKL